MFKPSQATEDLYAELEKSGWTFMDDVTFPAIGGFWYIREGDEHCYGIVAERRLVNRFGNLHGGVISTLADCALGRAARQNVHDQIQSTIDLNIHFVSAGSEGDFFVARGRIVRETKSIVFANGRIEANGKIIADVSGIWKVHKRILEDPAG